VESDGKNAERYSAKPIATAAPVPARMTKYAIQA
jgi:hypothetical protein